LSIPYLQAFLNFSLPAVPAAIRNPARSGPPHEHLFGIAQKGSSQKI